MRDPSTTHGRAITSFYVALRQCVKFYSVSRFALFWDFTQRIMVICYRCCRQIYWYHVQMSSSPTVNVHGVESNTIMALTAVVEVSSSVGKGRRKIPLLFRQSLRLMRWAGQSQLGAAVLCHSFLVSLRHYTVSAGGSYHRKPLRMQAFYANIQLFAGTR
jgi:hypothetical protein